LKTKSDPRHRKRREIVISLFSLIFNKNQESSQNETVSQILDNLNQIDQKISLSAPEWPLERINKIDLAILRLAVYELVVEKKQPPKVIIDEAIELAKEFGSEGSASFVNGVLGNIWKQKENDQQS